VNLHEFVDARLNEEPDSEELLRRSFPAAYANPGVYEDAPWTYAPLEQLREFAARWSDHSDYHAPLHAPFEEAARAHQEEVARRRAERGL
jgi:hypothetical protein